MQETTKWQQSGRADKTLILLIALLPAMAWLMLLLLTFFHSPPQAGPLYPCRLLEASLAEVPPSDGEYKIRARFQYLDGGEWVSAKVDDILWPHEKTYSSALLQLEELQGAEKLVCRPDEGGFQVFLDLGDDDTAILRCVLGLILLSCVWTSSIVLVVTRSPEKLTGMIRSALPVAAILISLASMSLIWFSAESYQRTSDWVATECQVNFLNYPQGLLADVSFQYTYEGKKYEGARVYSGPDIASDWPSPALARVLQGADRSVCYVNPNKPDEACLERSEPLGFLLALLSLPIAFISLSIFSGRSQARLIWQPHNPRRSIAFCGTAFLALAALLVWATPGFLGLLSRGGQKELFYYVIGLGYLVILAFKVGFDFQNLGLSRPRIRFDAPLTERRTSYTLSLEFPDEPVLTDLWLQDPELGSTPLLMGLPASHKSPLVSTTMTQ